MKNKIDRDLLEAYHDAVKGGDTPVVEQMLEDGMEADAIFEGNTPILIAIDNGYAPIIRLLLEAGANPNFIPPDGVLSRHGRDVKVAGERTLLNAACLMGYLESAAILLDHGASPRILNSKFQSAAHLLLRNYVSDEPERSAMIATMVRRILTMGLSVNQVDCYGETLVHACLHGNQPLTTLQILTDYGADLNIESKDDRRPLHMAAACGRADTVAYLLENGVDVNSVNSLGQTALFVSSGLACMEQFLRYDPDLNCQDITGQTALCHRIDQMGPKTPPSPDITRLIAAGPNLAIRDFAGEGIAELATRKKLKPILQVLAAASARGAMLSAVRREPGSSTALSAL